MCHPEGLNPVRVPAPGGLPPSGPPDAPLISVPYSQLLDTSAAVANGCASGERSSKVEQQQGRPS